MTNRLPLPLWLILSGLVAAVAWAGVWGAGHLAGRGTALQRAEGVFLDLRLALHGPIVPSRDVVIVAIDDATVTAQGGYPLDRATLARLVRAIADGGAQALAVDLLLLDASTDAADAALAEALTQMPTVLAGAGVFDAPVSVSSAVPTPPRALWPEALFRASAAVGLVNVATDAGGTPRHMPMLFVTPEGPSLSFSAQAVGLFSGAPPVLVPDGLRLGDHVTPLDIGLHLPLRALGPRGTIPTISAQQLLAGTPSVDLSVDLSGKLVLLGATATAIGDRFATPFDPIMPGVEVLGTGISNLLQQSALIRDSRVRQVDVALTVALAVLGVLAVSLLPLTPAVISFGAALVGWLTAASLLFAQGYWFAMALPMLGAVPPVAGMALLRQVQDRRQAAQQARAHQALARFHAPALAERIAQDPEFLRHPVQQDAAVLFIDLSGFTGASERLGPAQTQRLLKSFHTLLVDTVAARGGVVLDFMGDGAMIGFGIPNPEPDDASRALGAGFDLSRAVTGWRADMALDPDQGRARIGAHIGPVVLSRLGHDSQQQIAASGDCVNVASRLMEVGKDHGAALCVSQDLLQAADQADGACVADEVLTVPIRGRQATLPVALWYDDGAPRAAS